MLDQAAFFVDTKREKPLFFCDKESCLLQKFRSKGLSFYSFPPLRLVWGSFLKHFALHALAHFTIPKSVWLSRGITQSTSVGQEKQKRYVQGYERTVNPAKYFPNDASEDQFRFLEAFSLEGALSGVWLLLDIFVSLFWKDTVLGENIQCLLNRACGLQFLCTAVHSYCMHVGLMFTACTDRSRLYWF